MAATTCYKVGDYAYFETSQSSPYAIRRIEELIKVNNGVEARVMCFYRRREIPSTLLQLADKHQSIFDDENDVDRSENFSQNDKYQLKLKELFLSRQYETLPVSQIRGKCTVYLLHETEDLISYLHKPDTFFYSLVYEPHQKTLLADRGEIRVGPRFQAEITQKLENEDMDTRNPKDLETLVWDPNNCLTDEQIDQFLVVAKSIGTYARALDPASSVRQPSLHMSVACASRESTALFAMDTLHRAGYDINKALALLVPQTGPVLCRDEMEAWSPAEANMFEESLEKYGKDFVDIRRDFFPWKSLKGIVEYYYMWKTTDRYVQQRRVKAIEEEKRLKQIQLSNKFYPSPPIDPQPSNKPCESCDTTTSPFWCLWGSINNPSRLCVDCWYYSKKHGGFKQPPQEGERQGLATQLTDLQYPCTECNKVFHRQERLFAHMSAHRPYKCNIQGCDKEFKMKNMLARHITVSHHQHISPTGSIIMTAPSGAATNLSGTNVLPGPQSSTGIGSGGLSVNINTGQTNAIQSAVSPTPSGGSYHNPYSRIILKTKAAFYLKTTPLTKLSRSLCKRTLKLKHLARQPFSLINTSSIKAECQERLLELNSQYSSAHGLIAHGKFLPGTNTNSNNNAAKIQNTKALYGENNAFLNNNVVNEKLALNASASTKRNESFNSCNRKQEQPFQLITDKNNTHSKQIYLSQNRGPPIGTGKRSYEADEDNIDGKKLKLGGQYQNKVNMGTPQKRGSSSYIDAPDDLYYVSNNVIRKMRKRICQSRSFRKACRKMGFLVLAS